MSAGMLGVYLYFDDVIFISKRDCCADLYDVSGGGDAVCDLMCIVCSNAAYNDLASVPAQLQQLSRITHLIL